MDRAANRWPLFLASLALAAAAACTDPDLSGVRWPCATGAQCPAGQACVDGECRAPADSVTPGDGGSDAAGSDTVCLPQCEGRVCGDNGCGGACGPGCAAGEECTAQGRCRCARSCDGRACGDDGCGGTCGACSGGERCELGQCVKCTAQCAGRACGPDGCGGTCGTCAPNDRCDELAGQCECDPACGTAVCGADACGGSCGACGDDEECGVDGQCHCVPVCGDRVCGDDGCGGACGECIPPEECLEESGRCECVPRCGDRDCGPDGCGGACGECQPSEHCVEEVGQCECTRLCDGRECGDDGCGGPCGECDRNQICWDDGHCECAFLACGGECFGCPPRHVCNDESGFCECVPDCLNRTCGPDGCNGWCGTCSTGWQCNGLGECIEVDGGSCLDFLECKQFYARSPLESRCNDLASAEVAAVAAAVVGCAARPCGGCPSIHCQVDCGLRHCPEAAAACVDTHLCQPSGSRPCDTCAGFAGCLAACPADDGLCAHRCLRTVARRDYDLWTAWQACLAAECPDRSPECEAAAGARGGACQVERAECLDPCGWCPEQPGQLTFDRCNEQGQCLYADENFGRWVRVRAGSFTMGSPADEARRDADEGAHPVTLTRDVLLLTTEVLQNQWTFTWYPAPDHDPACSTCPVEQVSYWDALAFANARSLAEGLPPCYDLVSCTGVAGSAADPLGCQGATFAGPDCLGYRLPTEAEWEYAYRAGTTTAFHGGGWAGTLFESDPAADAIAWYRFTAGQVRHPGGTRGPNALGLYDLAGNVWEWVGDWYTPHLAPGPLRSEVTVDPPGPATGAERVVRGGSFASYAWDVRAAARAPLAPDERRPDVGLRLARTFCAETCASAGAVCGAVCGVSCGACGEGQACVDGACVCAPTCGAAAECGAGSCGAEGAPAACGDCPWPDADLAVACDALGRCEYGDPTGGTFVLVRPGTFTMGSPEDEPGHASDEAQHTVTLTRPYLLGVTEVSQQEWIGLRGEDPAADTECGDGCAVESVTWFDALGHANLRSAATGLTECYDLSSCAWVAGTPAAHLSCAEDVPAPAPDCDGWRLPTEAEWEYAYRAGTTTAFYSGDFLDPLDPTDWDVSAEMIAWYANNAHGIVHATRLRAPNRWALFELAGNVAEWVWDRYGAYDGDATDPPGPAAGPLRVQRGGHYLSDPRGVRAAARAADRPDAAAPVTGFRLARTIRPGCGNGLLEPGEACDRGAANRVEPCDPGPWPGTCDTCTPECRRRTAVALPTLRLENLTPATPDGPPEAERLDLSLTLRVEAGAPSAALLVSATLTASVAPPAEAGRATALVAVSGPTGRLVAADGSLEPELVFEHTWHDDTTASECLTWPDGLARALFACGCSDGPELAGLLAAPPGACGDPCVGGAGVVVTPAPVVIEHAPGPRPRGRRR